MDKHLLLIGNNKVMEVSMGAVIMGGLVLIVINMDNNISNKPQVVVNSNRTQVNLKQEVQFQV